MVLVMSEVRIVSEDVSQKRSSCLSCRFGAHNQLQNQ
jgi:hypothetical protein